MFGSKFYYMLKVMKITAEGYHLSFLRHIVGKMLWINIDDIWEIPEYVQLMRSTEIQTSVTYIVGGQGKVA